MKISKKLYDKLYPKHPLYDDIALHLRLKTLHWLSFTHLGLDPLRFNWSLLEVAASRLKLIDKVRTAAEKLQCIEECYRVIVQNFYLTG